MGEGDKYPCQKTVDIKVLLTIKKIKKNYDYNKTYIQYLVMEWARGVFTPNAKGNSS